jgi:hypothetical protein
MDLGEGSNLSELNLVRTSLGEGVGKGKSQDNEVRGELSLLGISIPSTPPASTSDHTPRYEQLLMMMLTMMMILMMMWRINMITMMMMMMMIMTMLMTMLMITMLMVTAGEVRIQSTRMTPNTQVIDDLKDKVYIQAF